MLWVYGLYNFRNSFSAVIVYRRDILTSKVDPRAVRLNVGFRLDQKKQVQTQSSCHIMSDSQTTGEKRTANRLFLGSEHR